MSTKPTLAWKAKAGEDKTKPRDDQKGVDIITKPNNLEWLQKCQVGTLKDVILVNKIQGECFIDSLGEIRLKYLGDDLLLIEGINDNTLKESDKLKGEGLWSIF